MDTISTDCDLLPEVPANGADLVRLPGLFRRWELPDILEAGPLYRIEEVGSTDDGTPLVAVYVQASLAEES